ncbi:MAG: hypothetical protein NTW07_12590 [candidate division Zixibacteria bacterium]|nr:hypothetical protein [candidate division Zixibacteria bacterium]
MKVIETLKLWWDKVKRWGAGLLNWLGMKSSLIVAAAAVIALFIYYDQTDIMKDNLEVMRHQQNTTDQTLELMKRQTEILTKESVRRFRPFPIINLTNAGRAFPIYGILPPDGRKDTITIKDINLVSHGSPEWDGRKTVALVVDNITFEIKNSGNSPLYITGRDIGGITHSEWFNKYNKSDEVVCRMALEKSTFWHPDIDLLVMPDSTVKVPLSQAMAVRTMNIETFDAYLSPDSSGLPFYVYLYLQYEDLYEETYDAMWMTTYIFDFQTKKNDQGKYIDSVILKTPFREKMRWDILFPGDSNRSSN